MLALLVVSYSLFFIIIYMGFFYAGKANWEINTDDKAGNLVFALHDDGKRIELGEGIVFDVLCCSLRYLSVYYSCLRINS